MPPILGNTTTTGENAAAPLTGSELVRGVQAGGNVKMTTAAIAALGYESPLSATGDLIVHASGADQRLAVGANGEQLIADATQPLGMKWYDALGAFVTNLAANAGAALIGFIQAGAGAIARTMQAKARDNVNMMDYGADPTGVADCTASINLASSASASYSSSLYRRIDCIGGTFKVGGSNATGYIRKGQKLAGAGMGATVFDASATGSNTAATLVLGTSSGGVTDGGGQAAEVADLMFLGGPSAYPNIDTTACAGWSVHKVFFSFPGQGILVSGADGKLSGSIFDGGLNQAIINGSNIQLNDNLHYLGNYQISIGGGTDITISGMQSEYAQYAAILLNPASATVNVGVEDCNFISNAQYGTYQAAIFIAGNSVDVTVSNSRFRNLPGMAIGYSTGVGCQITVGGNTIIDGLKTASGYAQSTTMGGIDCSNMNATISDTTLRNLPGQPILIGGTLAITVIIDGCRFSGNTGGSSEILITNSNASSKVVIRNCIGGGRPLVNSQSTVTVVYDDTNVDAVNPVPITLISTSTGTLTAASKVVGCNYAGTVTLTLPPASIYPGKSILIQTYTGNTVVSASANVVPINSLTAGTAILAAAAGKWATLVSNGGSWLVTSGN